MSAFFMRRLGPYRVLLLHPIETRGWPNGKSDDLHMALSVFSEGSRLAFWGGGLCAEYFLPEQFTHWGLDHARKRLVLRVKAGSSPA